MTDEHNLPLKTYVMAALRQGLREQADHVPALDASQLQALSTSVTYFLARRIGGRYIALVDDREQRDALVVQTWNGRNRDDVMRRFGISRSLFYKILARHKAQAAKKKI